MAEEELDVSPKQAERMEFAFLRRFKSGKNHSFLTSSAFWAGRVEVSYGVVRESCFYSFSVLGTTPSASNNCKWNTADKTNARTTLEFHFIVPEVVIS